MHSCQHTVVKIKCSVCQKMISKANVSKHMRIKHNTVEKRKYNISLKVQLPDPLKDYKV